MKPFFAALIVIIVISFGSEKILNTSGYSTKEVTSSSSVRLD